MKPGRSVDIKRTFMAIKTLYQKYSDIRQSRMCSAQTVIELRPKTKGVPDNNQRGRGSGPCRLWGCWNISRQIVPTVFVRMQRFKNDLNKVEDGSNTRPIILSMINGSKNKKVFCPNFLQLNVMLQSPDKCNGIWRSRTILSLISSINILLECKTAFWPVLHYLRQQLS